MTNTAAPRISVIVTNYNYEAYIGQAIQSVLSQTYPHVECIVVDDGSRDNSRSVIEGFPVTKQIFKTNGGQGSAIRAGIACATGQIFMSLDGDDFLYPDACQAIADAWQADLKCLNFKLDVYHFEQKANYCYPNVPFVTDVFKTMDRRGNFPSAPMSGNAFDLAYAKMILEKAVHLDRDGVDAYLLYSAPAFGSVSHINRALGGYRRHSNNISMSTFQKTEKNLSDHVYYQFWAQQNFQLFAQQQKLKVKKTPYVQGAYARMWHLWVADGTLHNPKVDIPNRLVLCLLTAWSFATEPGIALGARCKNITYSLFSMALPKPLRQRIQSRFMAYKTQ